jgi:hypothetical protein
LLLLAGVRSSSARCSLNSRPQPGRAQRVLSETPRALSHRERFIAGSINRIRRPRRPRAPGVRPGGCGTTAAEVDGVFRVCGMRARGGGWSPGRSPRPQLPHVRWKRLRRVVCKAMALARRSSALVMQRRRYFARNGRRARDRDGGDMSDEKRVTWRECCTPSFGGVENVGVDDG